LTHLPRKSFQDAALGHWPAAVAGCADAAQLGGKALQVGQLALNDFKVPLCNPAHFRAGRGIFGREAEEVAHLIEREAQIPAPANKAKPLRVVRAVGAVIGGGS